MSVKYLEQTFQLLSQAGLVRSVRGARGGYQLAGDPQKLTLEQIITVLEGDTDLVEVPVLSNRQPTSLRDCLEIKWSFPRKIDESGQAFGESIEQVISRQSLRQFLDRAVWMPLNRLTAAYYAGLTLADVAKIEKRNN